MKAVFTDVTTKYIKNAQYTSSGTYTINTGDVDYTITLIGGGGGGAYTDGGVDSYGDTAWAHHYQHSGGSGARFKGIAHLGNGTLTISVGAGGGTGGASYAVYTPTGGSAIEIARAGGGAYGAPAVSAGFWSHVAGGKVTYDENYFTEIIEATDGADGVVTSDVYAP